MIKIEIHAEDAIAARNQMAILLAGSTHPGGANVQPGIQLGDDNTNDNTNDVTVYDKVAAAVAQQEQLVAAPAKRTRRTKAAEPQQEPARGISSGEERVDPGQQAVNETDDADEERESAAAKEKAPELTHDDVSRALGAYVKMYGMPATQEDGPKVLQKLFGESVVRISTIPDTQEALSKAVDGINEMLEKNPFGRKPVKAA